MCVKRRKKKEERKWKEKENSTHSNYQRTFDGRLLEARYQQCTMCKHCGKKKWVIVYKAKFKVNLISDMKLFSERSQRFIFLVTEQVYCAY